MANKLVKIGHSVSRLFGADFSNNEVQEIEALENGLKVVLMKLDGTPVGADDINPENTSYPELDQASFQIPAGQTDYDIDTNIAKAWSNVTTAKELTLYVDQQITYKLNGIVIDGMILPRKWAVKEKNVDMTNVFITTVGITNCFLQLKGV